MLTLKRRTVFRGKGVSSPDRGGRCKVAFIEPGNPWRTAVESVSARFPRRTAEPQAARVIPETIAEIEAGPMIHQHSDWITMCGLSEPEHYYLASAVESFLASGQNAFSAEIGDLNFDDWQTGVAVQVPNPATLVWFITICAVSLPAVPARGEPPILPACASGSEPRFIDFAVGITDATPRADLQTENAFSRRFPTRLRKGLLEQEVDFAGHYVLVTFGCGTACLFGGWVDVTTGEAHPLPILLNGFGERGLFSPLHYKPDSRLMVMLGFVTNSDEWPLVQYYELVNGRVHGLCQSHWTLAAARRLGVEWGGDEGAQ